MAALRNNTPSGVPATGLPAATSQCGQIPHCPHARTVHPFGLHIAPCEAVTLPLSGLHLVAAWSGSFLFGGRAHA